MENEKGKSFIKHPKTLLSANNAKIVYAVFWSKKKKQQLKRYEVCFKNTTRIAAIHRLVKNETSQPNREKKIKKKKRINF